MKQHESIILIGPMGVGKSTIANALSCIFKLPVINIDQIKWKYFYDWGYDDNKAAKILEADGLQSYYENFKPYEYRLISELLTKDKKCIYDIGAGLIVNEDFSIQEKIISIVDKYNLIFLLYPDLDIKKSYLHLYKRTTKRGQNDVELPRFLFEVNGFNLISYFNEFFHPAKFYLKKSIPVITGDKSVSSISKFIVKKINSLSGFE